MALCTLPAWRPPQIDQGGLETSLQTQAHLEVEVLQPVTVTKLMFSQCWRRSHPRAGAGSSSCPSLPQPPSKTTCQQPPLPGPSAGAQGWQQSNSHLLLQSLAAQRHQDTHCGARQLHGAGPSSPIHREASPCPAHSTNTGEEWL